MIDSKDIKDLHPVLQRGATEFLKRCELANLTVKITNTLRDLESQDEKYAQGRTKPGNIITNVKGGYSYHNWGLAFDFAPLKNGKIDWNGQNPDWTKAGEIWEGMGGEWGGRWKSFVDKPHCQFTNNLTCQELKNGKKIPDDFKMLWETKVQMLSLKLLYKTYQAKLKLNGVNLKIESILHEEFNYFNKEQMSELLNINADIDTPNKIEYKNKIFVKVRDVCEKYNYTVDYDETTKTVIINTLGGGKIEI